MQLLNKTWQWIRGKIYYLVVATGIVVVAYAAGTPTPAPVADTPKELSQTSYPRGNYTSESVVIPDEASGLEIGLSKKDLPVTGSDVVRVDVDFFDGQAWLNSWTFWTTDGNKEVSTSTQSIMLPPGKSRQVRVRVDAKVDFDAKITVLSTKGVPEALQ